MPILDNPNASTATRETRRDMLAQMWRTLTTREGWTRYDDAAGVEWGAQYTPTGAVIVPRAGETPGGRRWRDWLVCIPAYPRNPHNPYNFDPCESVAEAIVSAESLPRINPAPVPTHYDGHGAACWCDQPNAAR